LEIHEYLAVSSCAPSYIVNKKGLTMVAQGKKTRLFILWFRVRVHLPSTDTGREKITNNKKMLLAFKK